MTGRDELRRVVVRDVPTRALLAADDHLSGLMREFRLIMLGEETGQTEDVPTRLHALIDEILARHRSARDERRRQAELAVMSGRERVDLELWMARSAAADLVRLVELLDEADAFCREGDLLSLSSTAEQREFRHWYTNEVVRQLLAP